MQVLVDHVLGDLAPPEWLRSVASSKMQLLSMVAITSFVLYVLSSLLDAAVSYSWIRVGQRMVYDLTRDLFSITQRQSLRFHARHPVGDSMSRIMTDSWCVYNVVESLLLTPGQAIVTLIAMVIIMARMDARLTVVSLIVAPAITFGSMILAKRLRR